MKLFATPKSHFSRKVRLLLDHMDLKYELVDVGNVAKGAPAKFSGNPAMSVPVLEDGQVWLIESDHIAAYLARTYGGDDPYQVLTDDTDILNARAVMNGIMGNEVKLVLSARTGLDPGPHAYFQKAKSAIGQGLAWLESRTDLFQDDALTYAQFHFLSMWDHLVLYDLVALDYPKLRGVAAVLSQNETTRRSMPPQDS